MKFNGSRGSHRRAVHQDATPWVCSHTPSRILCASIALCLALITTARAQTNSYVDGNGKWENSNSWSRGVAPSASDTADVIANPGDSTITIDAATTSGFPSHMTISNLTISANTLQLTNVGPVSLHILNQFVLTNGASLLITNSIMQIDGGPIIHIVDSTVTMVKGSSLNVSSNAIDVSSSGEVGNLNIAGGSVTLGNLGITGSGTGQVWVTGGGTLNAGSGGIQVGSSNSVGQITISNGTVLARSETVERGTMSVFGGTNQITSNLVVAVSANSTGTVAVSGGLLMVTNGVIALGNDGGSSSSNGLGVGQMTIANATVLANVIHLGSLAGGHGDITILANGVLDFSSAAVGSNSELVVNDVVVNGGVLTMGVGSQMAVDSSVANQGQMTVMNGGNASCYLVYVGKTANGTMTMSDGTSMMTVSSSLDIGQLTGSKGSMWINGGTVSAMVQPTAIGLSGQGQITLTNGTIKAISILVGNNSGSEGTLSVAGGTNTVTGDLIIGSVLAKGTLIITNGSVQANHLMLTNGAHSVITFKSGTLSSGGTAQTNSVNDSTNPFLVGDKTDAATFHLTGVAFHSFSNGLEIANNATLTGCGTINGSVTVDAGGTVVADCGGTLSFTGIVTNNGTMQAINGTTIEFYGPGPVVNNGMIDVINGKTVFHAPSTLTNHGTVLDATGVIVTSIVRSGSDVVITIQSVTGHTYRLQVATTLTSPTWLDVTPVQCQSGTGAGLVFIETGGALVGSSRFYRIQVSAPPPCM